MLDGNGQIYNSIQIWYTKQSSSDTDVSLQLDINIWKFNKKLPNNIFLDFGLKLIGCDNVDRVYIYIPLSFTKNNIVDLGAKLENLDILQGIFNANYTITKRPENLNNLLVQENGKVLFAIYKYNNLDSFLVTSEYGGTVLSFPVKAHKQTPNRYYRFRIKLTSFEPFIESHHPKNSFFESAFIETEFLDFRLNEIRNQNKDLLERISSEQRFKIEDINFFVMISIKDEVVMDGFNLTYQRQLETGPFWTPYLELNYENMSVYKCNNIKKEDNGSIKDFNCFGKINHRKSNLKTILLYLFVLLLITLIFSIISNYVWYNIEPRIFPSTLISVTTEQTQK